MVGIYKILSPSGKVYIGQSWNIKNRWWHYGGNHAIRQPYLFNSFKKYGQKNHVFSVVHEMPEDVSQEVLDKYEIIYWAAYKESGTIMLNMKEPTKSGKLHPETVEKIRAKRIGGPGWNKGKKFSQETRQKMSVASKGVKKSPEHIEKLKNINLGRKQTQEHIQNAAATRIGRKWSDESKAKITKTKTGQRLSDDVKRERSEKMIAKKINKI